MMPRLSRGSLGGLGAHELNEAFEVVDRVAQHLPSLESQQPEFVSPKWITFDAIIGPADHFAAEGSDRRRYAWQRSIWNFAASTFGADGFTSTIGEDEFARGAFDLRDDPDVFGPDVPSGTRVLITARRDNSGRTVFTFDSGGVAPGIIGTIIEVHGTLNATYDVGIGEVMLLDITPSNRIFDGPIQFKSATVGKRCVVLSADENNPDVWIAEKAVQVACPGGGS